MHQVPVMLERATIGDIAALHALIERAYRGDSARLGWTHESDLLGGQRTDPEVLRAMVADPSEHLLVHRGGAGIDACVALTRKRADLVYLGMVTVAPELQRHGIGKAVLAAAERHACADLGASLAEMTVIAQRHELIAWYERRGYRLTGERRPFPADPRFGQPKRNDLEFIVLEKRLRSPSSEA
jgi:ribosomal protein S18 acetylase RimI-like enzyme